MNIDDVLDEATLPDTDLDVDAAWRTVGQRAQRRTRRNRGFLAVALVATTVVGVVTVGALTDRPGDRETDVATESPRETSASRPTDPTDDPATPPSTASSTLTTDPGTPFSIGEGGWSGARTNAAGTELVIAFTGAAPFDETDPCSVAYRAEMTETPEQVSVAVHGTSPATGPTACRMRGYARTVTASLREPLGQRPLVVEPGGHRRPVFDGATLAEPGWLPDGWSLRNESHSHLGDDTWVRVWAAPPPEPVDDRCVGTDQTPISLTQGPPQLVASLPVDGSESTHDIRGNLATYVSDDLNRTAYLHWIEAGQAFVVTTWEECVDDTLTSVDVLVRFARGLEVP